MSTDICETYEEFCARMAKKQEEFIAERPDAEVYEYVPFKRKSKITVGLKNHHHDYKHFPPISRLDDFRQKRLIGAVCGVISALYQATSDDLIVRLSQKQDWSIKSPLDINEAIATVIAGVVEESGKLDNQGNRLCLEEDLQKQMVLLIRKAIWSKTRLRVRPLGTTPWAYRVYVVNASHRRGHTGDGRPAKRIERMKTAIRLRKQAA